VPPSGVLPSRHLLHPFRQSNPLSNSSAISSALDLSFSSVMKRASLGANVAKQSLEREGGEEETATAQSPKIR
jgi:hypothetical protein